MAFLRRTHPPLVSKKEEFHMKQTTLTQRLLSALVALCMVLSVCAPAFADVTDPDMAKAAQWCKTFFTQVLGRFTQVLLKKKVKYGIFKADTARILFWSAPMIHEWTVAWALPLRVCAMLRSRPRIPQKTIREPFMAH